MGSEVVSYLVFRAVSGRAQAGTALVSCLLQLLRDVFFGKSSVRSNDANIVPVMLWYLTTTKLPSIDNNTGHFVLFI